MTALPMTITAAGQAALLDAEAGGTAAVHIVRAGLTASNFVAAPTLTALPGEFKRLDSIAGLPIDNATVHLTIRDDSADAYTVRGIGLYLADGTLFAAYSQATPILGKADVSTFYLAVDLVLLAGQAALVQFGNTNFLNPPASETVKGVASLATIIEALAGAVDNKIMTPKTMAAVLANYVTAAQLGVANGVATLGPDGKLLISQRPPIDLIDVFAVPNQAAMLALAGATPGDFAVRADNGLVYVLQAAPPNVLANWLEISTPAPVSSVNGQVGTVVLTAADVGASPAGRSIGTAGLATGGGSLVADRVITVSAASQAQAEAGIANNVALTPLSIANIITALAGKVSPLRSITGAGLATGGGTLEADRILTVAIASAAEILLGLANDKAITPAGLADLPKSLTPNGFFALPGGLMLQWVQVRQTYFSEDSIAVTFPMAFQTIVLPIVATGYNAAYSNVRDLWPQQQGEPWLTGCTIQLQSDDGRDMRLDGFNLIVIGK